MEGMKELLTVIGVHTKAVESVALRLDKVLSLLEQGNKHSQPAQEVCECGHHKERHDSWCYEEIEGGTCLCKRFKPKDQAQPERDELIEEIVHYIREDRATPSDFLPLDEFRQFLRSKLK